MRRLHLALIPSFAAATALGAGPPAEHAGLTRPLPNTIVADLAYVGALDEPADVEPYIDESTPDSAEVLDWDAPDLLQGATCVPTPFLTYTTFDSSWNYGEQDASFTSIPSTLSAPTISGYGGSAPSETSTLGIASTPAARFLFASWRINLGVPLTADTIYRIQTEANSNSTVNQSNWVRFRFGGDFFAENGMTEQGYSTNSSSLPRAPRTISMLHWVKSDSAGFSAVGERDQPAFNFDLIDESSTVGGHNFTISGVTIDTIPRECLGVGTVIRNKGVETVSNEDGFAPDSTGLTPFSDGDGYVVGNLNDSGSTTAMASDRIAPAQGAMNVTFATSDPGDQTGFGAIYVLWSSADRPVTTSNSKLYATDLWISAPIASNSTTSRLPILRIRWGANQDIPANHGSVVATYYNLNADQNYDGTLDNPNGITLANSSKHYVGFWWPSLDTAAQPNTESDYYIDFLYNRTGDTAVRPNGTFSIERMTITEYDQPTF